jgi:peptide/nickel transport system permease protein
LGFCLIALLAPVLANHDPLLLAVNGRVRFPAFSSDPYTELPQQDGTWHKVLNRDVDWRRFEAGFCLLAPIPYAPTDLDPANANFVSPFAEQFLETDRGTEPLPFRYRHWLGTTRTGGDLLAALIHGTRYALLIGFLAALISALIGIGLGMLAGYYGDRRLRIGRTEMLAMLLTLFIAWFEGWFLPQRDAIPANPIWWCLPLITGILLRRRQVGVRSLYVPADGIVRSLTSVFLAVPRLVWIILIGATLTPAVGLVILTIGLTGWAEFAQLTRAETLRLRNAGFAEQARAAGLRNARILFLHLLPNFASLLVLVFFYHMAGAVLAESALSFLGAGVPHEIITWGGLLQEGRQALHAWWLMLFPGCCLFLLLNSLQTVSGRKAS